MKFFNLLFMSIVADLFISSCATMEKGNQNITSNVSMAGTFSINRDNSLILNITNTANREICVSNDIILNPSSVYIEFVGLSKFRGFAPPPLSGFYEVPANSSFLIIHKSEDGISNISSPSNIRIRFFAHECDLSKSYYLTVNLSRK